MRKLTLFITIIILAVATLVSCGNSDEVPEGLSIVEISEEHGFKFYCPEGWSVISEKIDIDTTIWGAKTSSFNNISITLAKTNIPTSLAQSPDAASSLRAIKAYFTDSLGEFPEKMEVKVTSEPTLSNFGNAKEAYKCIYTYKYETYEFACMQYFVRDIDNFYIFTYTSYGDPEDEESDFRIYLDKVEMAIKNFVFTEKGESQEEKKTVYKKDGDGYNLVSDKTLSGFELYLPDDVEVIVSDGYVTAKLSDSASIYLGKATATGVQINKYWENRKKELERLVDKDSLTEIEVNKINKNDTEKKVVLGNLAENRVASYEFTYDIDGSTYHVYQIMGVDTFNGYVFVYTATEEEYANHLELVDKILSKIKF